MTYKSAKRVGPSAQYAMRASIRREAIGRIRVYLSFIQHKRPGNGVQVGYYLVDLTMELISPPPLASQLA